LEAVALIREHPTLAPIAMRVRGREQRRILMKRTACHLYCEVDEGAETVTIVSAWGAARGQRPPLR
jgi:hypothetical protein